MNPKFDKNPYMRRGPVPAPGPAPGPLQIVIEVNPVNNSSTLQTKGPLTAAAVLDILIGQVVSLWQQLMKSLLESNGLIDPKTGLPLATSTVPSAATPPAEPGTTKNGPGEPGADNPPVEGKPS